MAVFVQKNIFSAAITEFDDVLFFEFNVSGCVDTLIVEISPVGRVEVNNVWFDFVSDHAIL